MALAADRAQDAGPSSRRKVFAFIFPLASGPINPSFPVARALCSMGHAVHYLCREQFRAAVEDAGAEFHSEVEAEPELYDGREPDKSGALESISLEHGWTDLCLIQRLVNVRPVQTELQLPGVIRWLRSVRAAAVLYCPLCSPEAACAARVVGIQSVALYTWAGPGAMPGQFAELCAQGGLSGEQLREAALACTQRRRATERINAAYGLDLVHELDWVCPLGRMDVLRHSTAVLVTTIDDLQDPAPPHISAGYHADGVRFDALGPLLDAEGAKRASTYRVSGGSRGDEEAQGGHLLAEVRRARSAGRRVVLVSMGTVLTGDSPFGWRARPRSPGGAPRGLSGCELCRAAWAGAFDAFGRERREDGPLLVVSLGPQADPLGDIPAPGNALCAPTVPQLDILRAGVEVFLTHGGQNSFTESLSAGTPMVVCPAFGDQPANGARAEARGVGLQVPRPDPDVGGEAAAVARYREDVAAAMCRVGSEPAFAAAAAGVAARLARAGGVPRAAAWMLAAASCGPEPAHSGKAEAVHLGDDEEAAARVGGA